MNLLILTETNSSYNSIRPEAEVYISLLDYGHKITIMTQADTEYAVRFKEHGITVIDTSYGSKISLSLIFNIRKIIQKNQIDIIYATNSKAISNGLLASMGTKAKFVTYRGTTGGLYRRDPSAYLNALNPRVNGVICVSSAVERHVKKQLISTTTKTATIYKGHDTAWYDTAKVDLSQFGTTNEAFNVAFVANVRPHKGLIYLLQAAHKLAPFKDIHIVLIGSNINQEPYLSEIEACGMKDRIHLTGFRNDAPQIISSCSVLIQASTRKEGLPRVIMESLSVGTPVIASAIEGNSEIITDGVDGFIVPVKDSSAIAQKILELYNNKDLLDRLSNNTQNTINKKLSHKATVEQFDSFFKELF